MVDKVLKRTMFEQSRLLEYFTERELDYQTGHIKSFWPSVIVKELTDNSLDACENASWAPVIKAELSRDDMYTSITIEDNGPGLKPEVISKILNYKTRTSDKNAYVSPTRGAQGNALKTVFAIPYVLSTARPKKGLVEIESCGVRNNITVTMDMVNEQPTIEHNRRKIVKTRGCRVTVWLENTCIPSGFEKGNFLQILRRYRLFNPHLSLSIKGPEINYEFPTTDNTWVKWKPNDFTSPLWYASEDLKTLVLAHVAYSRNGGPDLTLREFVSQFRGVTSTAKQKEITRHFPKVKRLSDLVDGSDVNDTEVSRLLGELKGVTKPVPPRKLGIIGQDHIKYMFGADDIKYSCRLGKGEIPFVVECAYVPMVGSSLGNCGSKYFGLNFAPIPRDPLENTRLTYDRKSLRLSGYGVLGLAGAFLFDSDYFPVDLVCHIVYPRLRFANRSKDVVNLSDDHELAAAVSEALGGVLADHYRIRKREERQRRVERREEEEEVKEAKQQQVSVKDAVFKVMKQAASKASANFSLPYSVRQLYYQVRPLIQEYTNKELKYAYFTPPLVTDYEEIYGPLQGLIYEPRGHLIEPHRDIEVPLGTVDVAGYEIPGYEYNKILYIEKEGFRQIFDAVKLGQRYDMALMTAKGFATRAAKQLLDHATTKDITILAAHDADISGYEIARTLESETRTTRGMYIDVIDIGLTVKEALAMGLEAEGVVIQKKPSYELLGRLSSQEKEFLLGVRYGYGTWHGKRVELNAMTTDQLISWLEGRLKELGLQTKVLPPEDVVKNEHEGGV